jgi:hypothetical protein
MWPHSHILDDPTTDSDHGLDPGFEKSNSRKMNTFCILKDNIIPSEAIRHILSDPRLLVVYLWAERKYIIFWPSQRWPLRRRCAPWRIVACALPFLKAMRSL